MSTSGSADGSAPSLTPMASLLADRTSTAAVFTAGLVIAIGVVPLVAGLVAAFIDGQLATVLVPVGAGICLIGSIAMIPAVFFRRAHLQAIAAYRGHE